MDLRKLLTTNLSGLFFGRNYDTSKPQKTKTWKGPRYRREGKHVLDLLFVTDQLHGLVRVNAPIVQGLTDALSLDAPNSKVEAILLTMRDDLQAGLSLSEAMRLRPRFFPGPYADLIAAGEISGRLGVMFDRLSRESERRLELRSQSAGHLTYSAVVIVIQSLILVFLSTRVIPIFHEMITDFGAEIPWSFGVIVAFQDAISLNTQEVVLLLVLALLLLIGIKATGAWWLIRRAAAAFIAWIPGLRRIGLKRELATVNRYLSETIRAGVPLTDALACLQSLSIARRLKRAFARTQARVEAGQTLQDSLAAETFAWPRSFVAWAAMGERAGMLPETLEEAAEVYLEQSMMARAIRGQVIAPMITLITGGISLFAALAWYQTYAAIVEHLYGWL